MKSTLKGIVGLAKHLAVSLKKMAAGKLLKSLSQMSRLIIKILSYHTALSASQMMK
jgi:hypothetical protein